MKPSAAVLGLALTAFGSRAWAAGRTLEGIPMTGTKIRIDGDLREWPGKMTDLAFALQGSSDAASGHFGYDDGHVYAFKQAH